MKKLFEDIRAGASPDFQVLLKALGPEIPLLHRLKETPQEPAWHAEGDVEIHTEMVLQELYADLRKNPVSPSERLVLVLSALLHDLAKPLTTRPVEIQGTVRIAAQGHEAKGRSLLARNFLPWTASEQAMVMSLVGEHLWPKWMIKKERGLGAFRSLGRRADLRLLTRLELADMRGRRCDDQQQNVETVEFFGLYAEELEADRWESRWRQTLWNDFSRLSLSGRDWAFGEAIRAGVEERLKVPEEALYLRHAVPNPLPELVILVGPSGSGKSRWIQRHLADHAVVSLDELREEVGDDRSDQRQNGLVRQMAKERLKEQLRAGKKVVWDATGLRRDFRGQVASLGFAYRALVTIVAFLPDVALLFQRNRNRNHPVPDSVLKKQLEVMEWPDCEEAHRLIVVGPQGNILLSEGRMGEEPIYEG